ncbi:MAG: molecular chaperone TorD family protein [Gammaproteobacteria bacterium]|nr:molecular chaperone TorD family protein [Gammaproteobacteria bacterium]
MSDTGQSEIRTALLRAGLSHSLARACAYPGPAICSDLEKDWRTLLEFNCDWPEGLRNLIAGLSECLGRSDVAVLAAEHVRLFGPAARCPLTETSWGDASRLLGRAAQLSDIAGFYRAFGVEPGSGRETVPEDHIAMELEFMSILYLKEAHALNIGLASALEVTRDCQKKFLEAHLATWVDYWFEQLRDIDPEPFYTGLGTAVQFFVAGECRRLDVHPLSLHARAPDQEMGGDEFTCPLGSTH